MTPEETAAATATGTSQIASHFMMDAATYQRGAELGFEGIDFYAAGRAGVLGDVDADIVTAAFFWFEPGMVRERWESAGKVMPPAQAAREWALAAHAWGEAHLPDDLDTARLAELAGKVVDTASPAGAAIFAGWRLLPRPSSPKALASHHLNALRELRGALHGGAALAAGLRPVEALLLRSPHMAAFFGWSEPFPDVDGRRPTWEQAEAGTNRAMAHALAALTEGERAELTELVAAAHTATTG